MYICKSIFLLSRINLKLLIIKRLNFYSSCKGLHYCTTINVCVGGNNQVYRQLSVMISKISLLIVSILFFGNIFAKNVPLNKAKTIAENYYFSQKIEAGEKNPEFNNTYEHFLIGKDENSIAIYVFNIEKGIASSYEWVLEGTGSTYGNDIYASVFCPFPGTYTLKVRAWNVNVAGQWKSKTITVESPCKSVTGIEPGFNEKGIEIYPNPVKGYFELRLPNVKQKVKVQIVNITGKAQKEVWAEKTTTINISDLSGGTYFVKIYIGSGYVTKKIQILK